MSFLDKLNDSVSEPNDTDDLYKNQYVELEEQLNNANKTNNKNIEEINELKALLSEYSNQIINLKQSYAETINDLKSQLNFEKEINEKYLRKILEKNTSLDDNIKSLNARYDQDTTSDEVTTLKNVISDNNQELINSFSELMDKKNSSKEILSELENHKSSIEEISSQNKKLANLEETIQNNYDNFTDLINKNKENHQDTTSKIIEEIKNVNVDDSNISSEELDSVKELITDNKQHLFDFTQKNKKLQDDITNKIIEEISKNSSTGISEDVISKINESIKLNNQELIEQLAGNNTVKVEILDSLSDDLNSGNYENIEAYKKIRDLGIFDDDYYRNEYNYNLDIDPLLHYIYVGYNENKNPSAEFDNSFYIKSDSKIEESSLNPLVYFVTTGINEGNVQINEGLKKISTINKNDIDEKLTTFDIRGVKKSKRKPRIIVSLTTNNENVGDIHYTLYSLLNQKVKPDKLILWLNESDYPDGEYGLPQNILKLKKNGLSIRFADDIKSYKKIIPTLKTYPNDIVVTAEDNIFYPPDWLKGLYESYKNNDDNIIAHKVSKVHFDSEGNIDKMNTWTEVEDNNPSKSNFMNQEYGVLYPPHCFNDDVTDNSLFMDLCESDDLWLWTMAILNNKKVVLADNCLNCELTYINPAKELKIFGNMNDVNIDKDNELKNILNKYPEIIEEIKNE